MSTRSVSRSRAVPTTTVSTPAPPPVHSDDRIASVLDSPRAPFVFGGIVFGTVAIQVLSNPVALVMEGPGAWNLPLPVAAVVAAILAGCAIQASSLAVSTLRPAIGVVGSLAAYLSLAFLLGIPLWLTGMQIPIALSLFFFAARRPLGHAALAVLGVSAAHFLSITVWAASTGADFPRLAAFLAAQAAAFIAIMVGGAALGLWWGSRSRRLAASRAEAEAATHEHEVRVRRAQEAERARIAQELHDVAGQHLGGLLVLADAAAATGAGRDDEVMDLLRDVRAEGRFVAASLYGALADLRAVGGTPTESTRDLRTVGELTDFWQERGTPVTVSVSGDIGDLPAVVSTTALRVVQEAMTNVAKHAPGAAVAVGIEVDDSGFTLDVTNGPARAAAPSAPGLGLGWGLESLRERVDLVNGALTAGPLPDGGWRVRMRVPAITRVADGRG